MIAKCFLNHPTKLVLTLKDYFNNIFPVLCKAACDMPLFVSYFIIGS